MFSKIKYNLLKYNILYFCYTENISRNRIQLEIEVEITSYSHDNNP